MSKKAKKPYYRDVEFLLKFGNHLRKLREGKGLTQEELAIECDFEISQISRIERGKTNPSISTVKKISTSLEISIVELFTFLN